MLTLSKFQQATGTSAALAGKWFPVVLAAMQKYDISTPLRQAHFLAQVGHESSGFVHVEESLNYRYGALLAMFGNRISQEDAFKYGRVDSGQNAHPADQRMIGSIIQPPDLTNSHTVNAPSEKGRHSNIGARRAHLPEVREFGCQATGSGLWVVQ